MTRPLVERMRETIAKVRDTRWPRNSPRVFFLSPADHAEFVALEPPLLVIDYPTYTGGQKVTLELPSLDGIAVRITKAKKPFSRLFNTVGSSTQVVKQ